MRRRQGRSFWIGAGLVLCTPLMGAAQTAAEIIDRVDQLMRGESSHGRIEMQIRTENWDRSLTMEAWSLGTEYSLVRVESPAREAGTATLKAEDEIWNYLPRVDRTIKIPASMMMGSWMGSHFTNDDLVHESRLIEDYDIVVSADGPTEDGEAWDLTLTPKPEAPVVWGRIEYRVIKDGLLPAWTRYYDEDGELVRTMVFSEYREMDGRVVPTRTTVQPVDKPEESTVVIYHELEFGVGLDTNFFSLRNLRRSRDR